MKPATASNERKIKKKQGAFGGDNKSRSCRQLSRSVLFAFDFDLCAPGAARTQVPAKQN